ncbi:MAG: hypothetical protein ABI036_03475 [Fibrobacteria bacterium]
MRKHLIIGLLCAAAVAHSQTINVRGKIADATNKGIANASVELLKVKQKATSGADGTYALSGSTGIRLSAQELSGNIRLNRGSLELAVLRAAPISIEIFDAKGNLMDKTFVEKAVAGNYRLDLGGRVPANTLSIIKASIGKETKSIPYFAAVLDGDGSSAFAVTSSPATSSADFPKAARLAKVSAIVDTLKVSASGYAAKKVEISSYDTTVNVTLTASEDRWGGPGNPAGPSSGCGKPIGTLKTGHNKITSSATQRDFIIDIPADYKPDHPYRLFFCFHWYGGTDDSIASGQVEFGRGGGPDNYAYYGLKPLALKANEPAIFLAPQGISNGWGGEEKDHAFFEDMLALAKGNLCIDTTRVFVTGFSFGSMFSYSLSTNHQKQIRAGVGIAPANWNIWLPTPLPRDPIAWMQTTGMSDPNCKWINDAGQQLGAKFIALQRGQDNGCAATTDIPTTTVGSKTHMCYDFTGCKQGYPVKACTFDGAHIANVGDGGTGNTGKDSWIPPESWKFFTQF